MLSFFSFLFFATGFWFRWIKDRIKSWNVADVHSVDAMTIGGPIAKMGEQRRYAGTYDWWKRKWIDNMHDNTHQEDALNYWKSVGEYIAGNLERSAAGTWHFSSRDPFTCAYIASSAIASLVYPRKW